MNNPIQYGPLWARPAAASETVYFCTDCDAVYKSNGTTWTRRMLLDDE